MVELLLKEMRAWREMVAAGTEAMRDNTGASHEEMEIGRKPETEEGTMACQETEARPEEEKKPTSSDRKPEAAEEEIPEEDAEVMPVGEPKKKRRRDRNQLKMKKRTQEKDVCRREWTPTGSNRKLNQIFVNHEA
jgi:hypothetical protein